MKNAPPRIVSLLLTACLVADPSLAVALPQQSIAGRQGFEALQFSENALAAVPLDGHWMRILHHVPNPVRLRNSSRKASPASSQNFVGAATGHSDNELPKYTGAGATSIHGAIVDANTLLKDGRGKEAIELLTDLIGDLETAYKSQDIQPLMEKWNDRYPSSLEVDLLIQDIPRFIGYAKELLEALRRYPNESRSIVEIANDPDSPVFKEIEKAHETHRGSPAPIEWFKEQMLIQKQMEGTTHDFSIRVPDHPVIRLATGGQETISIHLKGEYPDVDHILTELLKQCPQLEELSFMWDIRIDGNSPKNGTETVLPGQSIEIAPSRIRSIWPILKIISTIIIAGLTLGTWWLFGPSNTSVFAASMSNVVEMPSFFDSMLPGITMLISVYFIIKAINDLSRAGYLKASAVLAGLAAVVYSSLLLYTLTDFNPLALSSWVALYLRVSQVAPLGIPIYLWSSIVAFGLGAYEIKGWLEIRRANHRLPTSREVLSGDRRFVVYERVRRVIRSSTFRRRLREALLASFAGLALLVAPYIRDRLALLAQKVEMAASNVKPISPKFTTLVTQQSGMHNAGSYFLQKFSREESMVILGQKTVRFTLKTLDGKDVRHFKIWVHSRGGQTINILSASRVSKASWITDRTNTTGVVVSNTMKDVYIDIPVDEIKGYLRVLNLIESKPPNDFDLATVSVEMNSETGLTRGETVSTKAQVKLEAYTNADKAGLTPTFNGLTPKTQTPIHTPALGSRWVLTAA